MYRRSKHCSSSFVDAKAAQNKMDAAVGWFADPIYLGQYPDSLETMLGDRLPKFTREQQSLVKGSSDVSTWAPTATLYDELIDIVLRYERTLPVTDTWSSGWFIHADLIPVLHVQHHKGWQYRR